jgi:hypothetical protein
MKKKNDGSVRGPFLDIGLAKPIEFHVSGLVRPGGEVLKTGIRRAHELKTVRGGSEERLVVAGLG